MKALSIQQPWAWLIVNGHKDVENRTWHNRLRGRIWIHASKKFDNEGYIWVAQNFPDIPLPAKGSFERGGMVGQATITGCVTYSRSPWFAGDFGFVLEDATPLPFTPYKGKLGFFEVEL